MAVLFCFIVNHKITIYILYVGHLWQDKYYAELIEDDKQMLETSRYIHLNPYRARMVERAEKYPWSSYKIYIGQEEEKIIKSDTVLCYFKEEKKRQLYKEFVESVIKIKLDEDSYKSCSK